MGNQKEESTLKTLEEKVVAILSKRKVNLRQLCDEVNSPPREVEKVVKSISKTKLLSRFSDGGFEFAHDVKPHQDKFVIDFKKYKEVEYPIGFVTDNHIGSKYERLDVLNALYDRFVSYGVQTVYNAGNWIDGEARFNKYDIYVSGVNDQIKNMVLKYPQRKGITTYYIGGDDHEGWYVQREHIDICQVLEDTAKRMGRNDLVNLGYMERDIVYKQARGKSYIRLIHAGGGSAYAISYTSQKYVEALQGGEKPNIILVGHYHKFDFGFPREVFVIQGGCTQDQTPFMRKKKLQAMVGGVVLWIKQNELGTFTSVRVEWIPFYDKKYYQYKW